MNEFPFGDGQLLEITSGGHVGLVVRVDERSSFFNPQDTYYEGDPEKGIVSREGWQIVLDAEVNGEWLYIFREHEDEVRRLTSSRIEL